MTEKQNCFHQSVMTAEAVEFLQCQNNKVYVDPTVGSGGHAEAILAHCGPFGEIICLDQDPDAVEAAKKRLAQFPSSRFHIFQKNFARLREVLDEVGVNKIDGIVFDLGVSSFQIDENVRGFAFDEDTPLDMRMNPDTKVTARELINNLEASALAHIFRKFGEEAHSYKIARAIEQHRNERPIETSGDLVKIIKRVTSGKQVVKTIARIFQALRIHINNELDVLKASLTQAVDALEPGGRIIVISYHSLEDRIVKVFFQDMERGCTCPPDFPYCVCNGEQKLAIITRKIVRPSEAEIDRNPRARSAKLRVAERVGDTLTRS